MEVFQNTFSEGLDQDTDLRIVSNGNYIDCQNVTMFGNGEYGSINPLPGTIDIGNLTNGAENRRIIKLISTPIITADGEEDGVVAFSLHTNSASNVTLDVIGARISPTTGGSNIDIALPERQAGIFGISTTRLLYRKVVGALNDINIEKFYRSNIDFALFKEQNVPVIYYTDGQGPLRRIICDLTAPILPLLDEETIAFPAGMPTPPEIFPVEGDSIFGVELNSSRVLCGTYQAAVRLLNPTTNQVTKWSLFSNPVAFSDIESGIQVFFGAVGVNEFNTGNVGTVSNKKMAVRVSLEASGVNTDRFSQYQLAIIENTTGTGIPKLVANVTPPRSIASASDRIYAYSNGEFEEQINIDEIVIDDAAVISSRSVSIKNGRLVQGGLIYQDFTFDNDPQVFSVTLNKDTNLDSTNILNVVSDVDTATFFKSYFRDEVYRFGLVYHDEYGNWSPVRTLDFSQISINSAEDDCIDFKFPSIAEESIFNSSGVPKHLSIDIRVNNHPTWAKGVALVRAKRIKNIQFQSPVIPTRFIQAPFASGNYPQLGSPNSNEDAQVGNIVGTLLPKELSDLYPVSFVQDENFGTQIHYSQQIITFRPPGNNGAGRINFSGASGVTSAHVLFNPNNLANFASANYEPYTFQDGDAMEIVDAAFLVGQYNRMDGYISDITSGFDIEAPERSVFAEKTLSRYYFNNNTVPTLEARGIANTDPITLRDYQEMSFGQDRILFDKSPSGLASGTFGDYESIDAPGLDEGTTPINQPMAVVVTSSGILDPVYSFNQNDVVSDDKSTRFSLNTDRVQNGAAQFDPSSQQAPSVAGTTLATFSEGDTFRGSVKRESCAVFIANVTRDLSDFRYGERDTRHEFVFTGAYANVPNPAQLITLSSRGGGDCHVAAHTFKIADNGYVKAGTRNDAVLATGTSGATLASERYNNSFGIDGTGTSIPGGGSNGQFEYARPIPARSRPETITVFLESEIDGSKINNIEHSFRHNIEGVSVPTPRGAGEGVTPFSYRYNLDYSIPNNNKVFFPPLRESENNNIFLSRLIYSDPKIYNSRDDGLGRFRVANILDLDEGYGPVNKLELSSDQLIAFQDEAIVYLPTDSNVIEQSDAATLAIRTDSFLGVPIYISNIMGSSSPDSVIDNGRGLYFLDDQNKNIMYMQGRQLTNISNIGNAAFFESAFSSLGFSPRDVNSFFDFERDEFVFTAGIQFNSSANNKFNPIYMVFSEKNNKWITKAYVGDVRSGSNPGVDRIPGTYTKYGLMLGDNNGRLHLANVRAQSNMLGYEADPFVRFSINPDSNSSKVYDVFNITANRKPEEINIYTNYTLNNLTYREFEEQTSMNLDGIFERENSFKVPILRDANGGRVRGNYAIGEVKFNSNFLDPDNNNPDNKHAVSSVVTKFRYSERRL